MDCSEIEGSSSKGRGSASAGAPLRAALAGGAAVAMVLAALGAANAAVQPKPPHAKQVKKEPPPKPLDMPLIQVSISKQQLTLFETGEPVAHSPVSTGMAGHLTPTGIFSVIGKEIFHRSNIYSGAPMPYMQRITWSGVAMHAGVLPGYPASHGCIRMPHDFAVRLYSLTRMGARVLVLPHEIAPVPFESARLFTRAKPASDKVSEAGPRAEATPVHVVRTAESQTPVMSDAVDTAAHALSGLAKPKPAEAAAPTPAEVVKARTPAPAEAATPTPAEVVKARTPAPAEAAAPTPAEVVKARTPAPAEAAAPTPAEVVKARTPAPAEMAPGAPPAETLKSAATTSATEAPQAVAAEKTGDAKDSAAAGPSGEPTTGTVMVKPVAVTAPQPIEVRKSFEPATGPSQGTQTFQPLPADPAAQPEQAAPAVQPVQAAPAVQPVQAAPAVAPAQPAPALVPAAQPAPAPEAKPAPAATAAAADEFYGPERPMRPGPITVFVSKKEGKLFVRKGFQPVFSWPVKFEHPELPLGTHLYTAVDANPDGVSFRWQVVSVPVDTTRKAEKHVSRDKKGHRIETVVQPAIAPPASTAAEAIERIDIPPVALTRISALMSKGASLIISDQGLGGETGTETDFIVLTR